MVTKKKKEQVLVPAWVVCALGRKQAAQRFHAHYAYAMAEPLTDAQRKKLVLELLEIDADAAATLAAAQQAAAQARRL